ncbi:hypothetical protein [Corynebacterium matruchotii]|jgi:putative uncharacterized protein (fragment)|uniref:DUF6414 family protein n=1 Tax=Corynebacterium matruchotii TaxID=43768 RepID=UPI0028E7B494|nr:hypothetical protein [Corynebacterium matruchotii]
MRIYRDPIYLDKDALTPIANSFGIEVDTSIEVDTRDLTNKKGGFDAGATIPGTSIGLKGNLGGGTESEISQKRTVTAHPGAALNNLIEKLQEDKSLIYLSDEQAITKSALIEIESDWKLSPVTDQGRILNLFIEQILQDPNNIPKEIPAKLIQDALKPRPADENQKLIFIRTNESDDDMTVIALLDSEWLVGNNTEDDLEEDRTFFGIVEAFKPKGKVYSLEKHFTRGLNRALRRKLDLKQLCNSAELSEEDLKFHGPLVVIKVIAVYP